MQQLNTTGEISKGNRFDVRPKYEMVEEDFLGRILFGEWKTDTSIPNESDLAREYGVSSGTMRKALDALEAKGFLIRKQGRGTFVLDKKANDQMRRLSCTRASLFIIKKAIEDAGKNASPKLQSSLQTHIAEALFSAGYSGDAG